MTKKITKSSLPLLNICHSCIPKSKQKKLYVMFLFFWYAILFILLSQPRKKNEAELTGKNDKIGEGFEFAEFSDLLELNKLMKIIK